MALLDFDGFEGGTVLSPTTTLISGLAVGQVVGRDGIGVALRSLGGGASPTLGKSFISGSDTIYFHWAKRLITANFGGVAPTYALCIVRSDGGTTDHLTLLVDGANRLALKRGTAAGTLLQTSTLQVPSGVTAYWASFQAKVTIHDTAGEVIVRFNGVEYLNYVGDTRNGGLSTRPDQVGFGMFNDANEGLDDWLINDTTGVTNNSWPGEICVVGVRAAGNGANSGLMGSDANQVNNYQQVDDPNPFNTTDYNGSATTGLLDTYDMTPVNKVGTVLAVQTQAYAAKTDAGAKSCRTVLRSVSSGSVVKSTDIPLSTSWVLYNGPVRTTDADGTAWTAAKVDAHEFGFEVV